MLHECSPRKTLGDSHGLRKCFHRTSLKNREGHNDDKMRRKRDEKSRLNRKLKNNKKKGKMGKREWKQAEKRRTDKTVKEKQDMLK